MKTKATEQERSRQQKSTNLIAGEWSRAVQLGRFTKGFTNVHGSCKWRYSKTVLKVQL